MSPARLLIIDEHEAVREALEARLNASSGLEVIGCTGCWETGLEEAINKQPDAVRIALSAYTEMDDLIAAINSGEVWRYLVKPWEPQELKVTVAQAMERHNLVKENQRLMRELEAAHEKLKKEYEQVLKDRDKYDRCLVRVGRK